MEKNTNEARENESKIIIPEDILRAKGKFIFQPSWHVRLT